MDLPPGLEIHYEIIDKEMEKAIIAELDQNPWVEDIAARRQQFFGYDYNPNVKKFRRLKDRPFTGYVKHLANYLKKNKLMDHPNQCIVNEYDRDGSIGPHSDAVGGGNIVIGFSLGADCNMVFQKGDQKISVWLPRRSLMIMEGEARWDWTHAIPKAKTYKNKKGERITKPIDYRRISLTYRQID